MEFADDRRAAPREIRAALAALAPGTRRCGSGRPATMAHRRGGRVTLRCTVCSANVSPIGDKPENERHARERATVPAKHAGRGALDEQAEVDGKFQDLKRWRAGRSA